MDAIQFLLQTIENVLHDTNRSWSEEGLGERLLECQQGTLLRAPTMEHM